MRSLRLWILLGLCGLASCEALAPLGRTALGAVGNLLSTAAGNHGEQYKKAVQETFGFLQTTLGPSGAQAVPASTNANAKPLTLDVALLRQVHKEGRIISEAIADGDVLRYRAGGGSDMFKITFRAQTQCYVYVILVDGTGWVDPLFPGAPYDEVAPVEPGKGYVLPRDNTKAWAVDKYLGKETIYFVVSKERRRDLENRMASFDAMKRGDLDSPLAVREAGVLTRGLSSRTKGAPITVGTRSAEQITPERFVAEMHTSDLVITRWFDHR